MATVVYQHCLCLRHMGGESVTYAIRHWSDARGGTSGTSASKAVFTDAKQFKSHRRKVRRHSENWRGKEGLKIIQTYFTLFMIISGSLL